MAIEDEFKRISEETAAIFQETLTSIAATFGEKLREETRSLDESQKQLLRNFKNNIAATSRSASSLLDIQDKLRDGSIKQRDIQRAISSIDSRINKINVDRLALQRSGVALSNKENENANDAVIAAENQKQELLQIDKIQKDITKELGLAGQAASSLNKIFKALGIDNPFGEALEQTRSARATIASNTIEIDKLRDSSGKIPIENRKTAISLAKQNHALKEQTSLMGNINKSFNLRNVYAGLGLALANKFVGAFQRLNQAQVESLRSTGEIVPIQDQYNNSLLLAGDYLDQVNSLTEQFGFNTTKAFDQFNVAEAAELTKFMGLAAGEANALALNAQISGENLKDGADEAVRAINPAFSQRKILQDIAKLSASITVSFQNSNVALAKAASDAKELGLNLDQVDKIAGSLLDIESSIAKEFEAEVISGRQLNLERARFFALTNDLAGVTRELTKQGIDQESFAAANRIEQEAIAAAVGLSRDELAASIQEQAMLANMSQEEIEAKEAADLKALTTQQMLNDSISKMAEVLAVPAAALASMLTSTTGLVSVFVALAPLIASIAIKAVTTALAFAATNPISFALIGAGLLGMIGTAVAQVNSQQVGDAILPSSGGPIVSTMEGGIFQGTSNDDVLMGPGIARGGRNQGLSKGDIDLIANAVKQGASGAQINLDGARVSNRIQPPLAVNTRKYSV
jgi:hypothetical protein